MKNVGRRNVLVAGVCAAALGGAALVWGPALLDDGPEPLPGPAARAMTAAHAGAPASLPDLAVLIGDRKAWLREHPEDDASWAVLGAAYTERGTRTARAADYGQAERALRKSLAVLPAKQGNVDAQLALGALANARGDYAQGRAWAERVRAQKPKRWAPYPVLIDAYTGLGDYAKAHKAAEALKGLLPTAAALDRAAQSFRDRGWREDANATAIEAAGRAQSPAQKAACLYRLGELAWERGEPAEAVAQYTAALRLAPAHGPSLAGRARALGAQGRTAEAFRDYRAALSAAPLPEYALEAGELYEAEGLDGDAATQYETLRARVTEAGSYGVNGELVLARYETDHGAPQDAVRRLRAQWAKGHRSMDVADALAWALYRTGEAEEALPYARRATEEGRRSALFTYHRGQIERALGRYGAARRHVAEALRINPYFSPLLAPAAREALTAMGDPPEGGPRSLEPAKNAPRRPVTGTRPAGTPSTVAGNRPAGATPTPAPTVVGNRSAGRNGWAQRTAP
ncbi:tetratricopeptide repeat protein [Streptomyces sp. NPDC048604]|uniref:tetratricopeptide repeat protein n=1 Tax=Streptomyces sp. NPDC048604 TaxID=3365578 RepID=UPI003710C94F